MFQYFSPYLLVTFQIRKPAHYFDSNSGLSFVVYMSLLGVVVVVIKYYDKKKQLKEEKVYFTL